MESRIAIIADAHLGGPGGAARPLIEQLAGLPAAGCRRLLLLGDLFQAWVGDQRFETPEVAAVVAALRELRGRGVAIDYVEGNRDFFLAGSPYADAFSRVGSEAAFEAGGVRYLAVHGDGLNDRDWKYLFWRRISKSAVSRYLAHRIPRRFARSMVRSTEQRLSHTNFKHRRELPEAAIRRYAERRLAEGHDVLLLGHFHEPRTWPLAGGEVRLLDAWFRTRRVEWLRPGARPAD
ncbi:MAG TPA: UDP-2,3-diacylglucosamine diphosphatase [Thermoanaerobaculia bacterium]|nr:UDP-2,3-diacylglucosamine diphosphatase [Thermoanaerobaculia bacterium]